jgi:hypothetical protein
MLKYSERLINLQNPQNVGVIEDAEGVGKLSRFLWGYHAPIPIHREKWRNYKRRYYEV